MPRVLSTWRIMSRNCIRSINFLKGSAASYHHSGPGNQAQCQQPRENIELAQKFPSRLYSRLKSAHAGLKGPQQKEPQNRRQAMQMIDANNKAMLLAAAVACL